MRGQSSRATVERPKPVRTRAHVNGLMDRRRHIRFALRGFVSLSWQERDDLRLEGNGFTRDISEHGVFVLTGARLPLGEAIQLEIVFCSPGTNSVVRMSAEGRVLRVEPGPRSEDMGGCAAAITSLVFRNGIAGSGNLVAERTPGGTPFLK
jgi:hypothetical protein